MKKSVFLASCIFVLSACVSEPIDPSFKGSAAVDKREAAKTRVSLGLTYLKNGNFTQAKSNLDRALKFDPKSSDAHFAMAFYFQQVDEIALAEQYYESALSLSDSDPNIVNSYGVFLCQQGKYDKAKRYFLDAVNAQNYAATAETYENLAICTQSQGDVTGAKKYFNSALNHQPTRSSTLLMLTNLYVQEGQWEEAKKKLVRYERSAPVSAETLYLNYQIAQGTGDFDTAKGYGNLLVRNYPEHEYARSYMSSTTNKSASVHKLVALTEQQSIAKNASELNRQSSTQESIDTSRTIEKSSPLNEPLNAQANDDQTTLPTTLVRKTSTLLTTKDGEAAAIDKTPVNSEIIEEQTIQQETNEIKVAASMESEVEEATASDTDAVEIEKEIIAASDEIDGNVVVSNEASPRLIVSVDTKREASEPELDNSGLNSQDSTIDTSTAELAEAKELVQQNDSTELNNDPAIPELLTINDLSELGEGWHLVQKKENLYRIALKYDVTMAQLMEWNGLDDASDILWGTRMRVKEPSSNE